MKAKQTTVRNYVPQKVIQLFSMDASVNGSLTQSSAVLNIDFEDSREAEIVKNTLQVDPEPSRSKSKKIFSTSGKTLKIELFCPDIRELRISLNSLMDHLHLVSQTVQRFGPVHPPAKKTCMEES